MSNTLQLPNLGLGLGLRSQHYQHILNNDPIVDWFEIISENYINNHGFARHALEQIAAKRPIVMHGVSLSIGSTDPLNFDYLYQLKELAEWLQPQWISDHLCWTGFNGINTHDLLPVALNEESLQHIAERILQVQDYLQRPLILENPSSYLEYNISTIPEWEFLNELTQRTNCGILLDVNNVYVSSFNHGYDPMLYINGIRHESIVQVHLAGPTLVNGLLIDTHDQAVVPKVWELYSQLHQLTGGVSTLLEWDANIPDYPDLVKELFKAKEAIQGIIPSDVSLQNAPSAISTPISHQLNYEV